MFCPKCKGIQDVIKVHEAKDLATSRLCDVQCLQCKHIVYYQPYDFGNLINVVHTKRNNQDINE